MAIFFKNISGADLFVNNLTIAGPDTPNDSDGIHTDDATLDYSITFDFGELYLNEQLRDIITVGSLVMVIGRIELTPLQTQQTWDLGPFFWAILTSKPFREFLGNSIEFDEVILSGLLNLVGNTDFDNLFSFVRLIDTPAALGTAGQLPAVNSDGDGLIFIDAPTVGTGTGTGTLEVRDNGTPVSTNINTLNFGSIFDILITGQTASITIPGGTGINWRHQEFRAGILSVLSRTWYRQTSNNLVNARMPSTDFLPAGWHAFFANDSNSGEMALFGDFDRGLGRVFINPNRGREISWNGTIFLQGSDRQFTASRNFRSFSGNPVNPGKVITAPDGSTYTAGANGFNSNESDIVRNHVRNTNIRLTNNIRYTFDLPLLTSATFELTPIDSGYEIEADGSTTVTVRPLSDDEIIIMDDRHYNFNSPMFVRRNARVAIRRLNENQWIVFDSSGSIAGGFNP